MGKITKRELSPALVQEIDDIKNKIDHLDLPADNVTLDIPDFTATNVKDGMHELFTSVSSGKQQLETAITDKGGTVSKQQPVPTFGELDAGIRSIPQAKGNATRGDVLAGKTFSSEVAGIEVAGTMVHRGSPILQPGSSIPPGYYSGGSVGSPPHNFQIYSTAGTYSFVVPSGVNQVVVMVTGGGGGGGMGSGYDGGGGGGGGGGHIAIISVSSGQTIPVVVGAGGAGGSGGYTVGRPGGNSSFNNSIIGYGGSGGDVGNSGGYGGRGGMGGGYGGSGCSGGRSSGRDGGGGGNGFGAGHGGSGGSNSYSGNPGGHGRVVIIW